MNASLIFLILFFLGRLFFYDINLPLFGIKSQPKKLLRRILFGLFLFLFIGRWFLAGYYFLIYGLLTLLDMLVVPQKEGLRPVAYAIFFVFPFLTLCWQPQFPEKQLWFSLTISWPQTQHLLLIFLGYVLTIKEGTIVIRLVLNNLKTVPVTDDPQQPDKEEYERGKWIGVLERTFVYFLVIFNQIGAIALIIALKSLARFNELNKKSFAEYFLIGSFLSLLVAALPAVIVRLLI